MKILKLLHKVQEASSIKALIIDDTVEGKSGKYIEGSRDALWSNKEKRNIRGINVVSLNYSDGYSNFMLDFAIAMGNDARVNDEAFANNKIWNFTAKEKTLSAIYARYRPLKKAKAGTHGKKIKFTYFSINALRKNAGVIKILFIETKENLIPIASTD